MKATFFVTLTIFLQTYALGQVGVDNRVEASPSDPWMQGVGRLSGPGCTGTVIDGRYLLTAAHCNEPQGFCLHSTTDVSSCPANNYFKVTRRVSGIIGNSSTPVPSDWNIYELDRTAQAMSVNSRKPYVGMKVTIVGYPAMLNGGLKPMVHRNCVVTSVYGGQITTDCDATPGNSGGPIMYCEYNSCDLVGVMVRGGSYSSIACAVSNFQSNIHDLNIYLSSRSLGEPEPIPRYTNYSNYYTHSPSYNNGGSYHYTLPPTPQYNKPPPIPRYEAPRSRTYADYQRSQQQAEDLLRRTESLIRR